MNDLRNHTVTAYGITADMFDTVQDGRTVARITLQEKDLYKIVCAAGELQATVTGKFRYQASVPADYPAVGDFVIAETMGDHALIHQILPRHSAFCRKIAGRVQTAQIVAANIDTLLICMSLNRDFNLRRLERYLALGYESGAMPVVVLTKADLCNDPAMAIAEVTAIAPGVPIHTVSSVTGDAINTILPYIQSGKTVSLIGSSGVGKSTLINLLRGHDSIRTNGLRDDDRGRNTTTHRELFLIPGGGCVIDTPGMREIGLWQAGEGTERSFSDIETLATRCRYRDCTHTHEQGCAVCAALTDGTLDASRYESFLALSREATRGDKETMLAKKNEKMKMISRINKQNRRER